MDKNLIKQLERAFEKEMTETKKLIRSSKEAGFEDHYLSHLAFLQGMERAIEIFNQFI
jgi:hypothetical protein